MTNTKLIIKKYANRRLYNTNTSQYITLEDLFHLIKQGTDFVVYDAKTNEDITKTILTQIIFEQEAKGYNILSTELLKQIILFYDSNMGNTLSSHLLQAMEMFTKGVDQSSIKLFEEMTKKNMELYGNALKAFFDNKK
jgi:polyhydroxyalkanoate synthesis repressor PhaR